jgi:hypothetical protein
MEGVFMVNKEVEQDKEDGERMSATVRKALIICLFIGGGIFAYCA